MARVDGPGSAAAYPPIDTTVDNAQPAQSAPKVDHLETAADTGIDTQKGAESAASTSSAKRPLTDPTEKSFTLLRFNQTGHTGETSKHGSVNLAGPGGTPGSSSLLGMRLGRNNYGEEVHISREVGSPQGYANKFEAIAAARFGKAEPAAVVQSNDGKWHAVETTANFYGGMAAADTPTRAVDGLASSTEIENARKTYVDLQEKLDKRPTGPERDDLIEQFKQAQTQLASLLFGVQASDINFDPKHLMPDKINLVPAGEMPAGAGGVTKTIAKPGDDFANRPIVLELDINKLKDPAGAMGTLFHEATHVQDLQLAQSWVRNFEQQTKQSLSNVGPDKFEDWLKTQVDKGGLSKADKEIVMSELKGPLAIPEARAHVHAALAALKGNAPEVAKRELVNYVQDIGNHEYGNLIDTGKVTSGAAVKESLTREILAAFQQMPKAMQDQLRAAIAAAKEKNPDAWLSQITLPKGS